MRSADPVARFHRRTTTVTVTATGESTVLAAVGDLDQDVAERLFARLNAELLKRPRALLIDLTRVGFCSAAALRILLLITAEAHAAGIPCVIASDQHSVRRPITALHLEHQLPVYPTLADARERLALCAASASRRAAAAP
ncbi:STAS domain-containing protein [Amycolatopsis eburnea]|uniref:Anti-sigma factor antagonist n=1 Tax=Amycolatopsis eburnea TaxID=2267691 RepID=A0A427T231_9PSEU|nr:STAS domain-containing protein [Amycolatopsis eburnea]RSD11995.1 anti-sigma factor antagonist [Amycolatopsis eburnea]